MDEETELEDYAPWLVFLITAIGGFLRILLLGNKGMWLDETFSVWLTSHTVPDMLQWIVRIDQHPPLYYLLLYYWIANYGDTPYYARLFSALFGTLTIPIIYLIGKRMSGVMVGLAAVVFLTFSPFHIYFAQEARMYTLLTFNVAMAIYALVRLLTDPRSIKPIGSQFRDYLYAWRTAAPPEPDIEREFNYKDEFRSQSKWRAWISRHRWLPIQSIETDLAWVTFIVFSAATLLTHNLAVFFPVATNLFVLALMFFQRWNKPGSHPALLAPSFRSWVNAQIGTFLLWSPWLIPLLQQVGRVDQEFWLPKPTWEIVTETLRVLVNPSAPGQSMQVMMMWTLCAMLCLGLVYYRKRFSIFLFLVALFAVPFLGELIVSLRRPIFLDRTLIWITIPFFLLLAAGIAQLRFRLLMVLMLGILGTNYLFSAGDYYRFLQKEDWNTAAGYVANFVEEDDLILFNSNFVEIPFNYYFRAYEKKYLIEVEKHGLPLDLIESGILEPRMTTDDIPGVLSLLSGHDRVWLVYSHDLYTDPMELIPQTLASKMTLIRTREFSGGLVQLYEVP
ncbi:MAG: glycosyltransferase family 39 protein [Anaerolineales bacterium]|nr:glycosyltransferase family 39 protein [Anaerolineales bacterium]